MALGDLTDRQAVLKAIAECDLLGPAKFLRKYGFRRSPKYRLHHNEKTYDAKAIAGVAHGIQHPKARILKSGGFTSGLGAVKRRLERLGFSVPVAEDATVDHPICYPDEVTETVLREGATEKVVVNAYERSRDARDQCLAKYGTVCCICMFDFGATYGPEFKRFIHVHHLRPLSEIGEEYEVDPVADLRPVCPNCHAVIHYGPRCRSIEEVRDLIANASQSRSGKP